MERCIRNANGQAGFTIQEPEPREDQSGLVGVWATGGWQKWQREREGAWQTQQKNLAGRQTCHDAGQT
jgi:hypothetical protein